MGGRLGGQRSWPGGKSTEAVEETMTTRASKAEDVGQRWRSPAATAAAATAEAAVTMNPQ